MISIQLTDVVRTDEQRNQFPGRDELKNHQTNKIFKSFNNFLKLIN